MKKKMRKTFYVLGLLSTMMVAAQNKQAIKFAKTITAEDLKMHLSVIASDEYEGRETGEKGQKLAAKYISNHFKELGLEAPVDGSYFQSFDLARSSVVKSYLRKGEERKEGFKDFIYYSEGETYGEEYINVIIADPNDENSKFYKNSYVAYRVKEWGALQDRISIANQAGAKGIMIILESDDEFGMTKTRLSAYRNSRSLSLEGRNSESDKLIVVDRKVASWMFEKKYDEIDVGDETQVIFSADYLDKIITAENVLGFLEGTENPEELIIVTAHYDHLGITNGEVNNGADDDGSGTVAVLELAEAFSRAAERNKGPKRSILFMTVSGEEKGLLGSRYYTDVNPVFPLENTVANLNIDMIGRVDDKHAGNPDYIYLIGADKLSKELHDISEKMNKTYSNLDLDYTFNDENDPNRFYYRSDHYNFAKNDVPVIFYFNGVHEDYHKPTDTVEKINFSKIEKITRLVFHTAWELANREERIKLD